MERPCIHPEVQPTLEQLARLWSFKRKALAAALGTHIGVLEQQAGMLYDDCAALREQSVQQTQENDRLTQTCAIRGEQLLALESKLQALKDQYAVLKRQYDAEQAHSCETAAKLQAAAKQVAALEQEHTETLAQIAQLKVTEHRQAEELAALQENHDLLNELTAQLKTSNAHLQEDYEQISQRHMSLSERFGLVQRILALRSPANSGVTNFARLIREDYQSFAARESSLADEAGALLALQQVQRALERITNFPAISGRTLLAIAGGFSSGKSEFINSFIQDRAVQLATGMNPVTVVPSYVVCSLHPQIRGYCANGGSIELGSKLYGALSHEYLEGFGFDLRRIMPSISVQAPMDTALFEHICLLDTPGYNPGGGSSALSSDRQTAEAFVGQCETMIWVIGLDPAGTITQSDIEFIEQTGLSGQSLYIVLNKADLKSGEDIEAIMAQVAEDLSFAGIEYAGISAYSSTRRRVYSYAGLSLEQFLQKHNRRDDVYRRIEAQIEEIFNRYSNALHADLKTLTDQRKQFNALKLDALEGGGTAAFKQLQTALAAIEATLNPGKLKELLRESEKLCLAFKACARQALEEAIAANTTHTNAAQVQPA